MGGAIRAGAAGEHIAEGRLVVEHSRSAPSVSTPTAERVEDTDAPKTR